MKENEFGEEQAEPLVSVIMPAYNAEKYIEEAICSVLSQTYTNWELLILDDCSPDRTVEIAEKFEKMDTRVRLLRNPKNIGVARTRNRGLDLARGEWIALLDSDDVWHSEKLQKQITVAANCGADIVYCSYAMMDENGGHLSNFIVPETTSYDEMLKESVLSCSTVLIRRTILAHHRFSVRYSHEDLVFWLELLRYGYKVVANREILAEYRIVKGSRSNDKLKSARNRWLVYRKVEKLSLQKSISVFIVYAFRGVAKYGRLR